MSITRLTADPRQAPPMIIEPLANALRLKASLVKGSPISVPHCEHVLEMHPQNMLWTVSSADQRGYLSCGGCAVKRSAFREACDECSALFTDDGQQIYTAYVDDQVALLGALCIPCIDIYGDVALLSSVEVAAASKTAVRA